MIRSAQMLCGCLTLKESVLPDVVNHVAGAHQSPQLQDLVDAVIPDQEGSLVEDLI